MTNGHMHTGFMVDLEADIDWIRDVEWMNNTISPENRHILQISCSAKANTPDRTSRTFFFSLCSTSSSM